MEIETKRLILWELTESDDDALYRVLDDSDIRRHPPDTFDKARVHGWIRCNIARYQIFGFGLWAVCRKDTGALIGDCGLIMQRIHGAIRPEIGYHIRRDQRRAGYAAEAAAAVRDWAFQNTPFRILYSYMDRENIPSARTAMAYGCQCTEIFEEDGRTVCVYAVTRAEWAKKSQGES